MSGRRPVATYSAHDLSVTGPMPHLVRYYRATPAINGSRTLGGRDAGGDAYGLLIRGSLGAGGSAASPNASPSAANDGCTDCG